MELNSYNLYTTSLIDDDSFLPKRSSILRALEGIKCLALTVSLEESICNLRRGIEPNHVLEVFLYFVDPSGIDVKEVLDLFISRLSDVHIHHRTEKCLVLESIESDGTLGFEYYGMSIRFLKFPNIGSLIAYFTWVDPVIVYYNGYQYISEYTSFCKRKGLIPCLLILEEYDIKLDRTYDRMFYHAPLSNQAKGCHLCSVKVTSRVSMFNQDTRDNILSIARGLTSVITCVRSPKTWDQECFTLDDIVLNTVLGNVGPYVSVPQGDLDNLIKTFPKPLALQKVLDARLPPVTLLEPPNLQSMMCLDCLSVFEPVWEPKYYPFHKERVLPLYLILSKMGLSGDLIQYIYSIICLLKLNDRYLEEVKKLAGL